MIYLASPYTNEDPLIRDYRAEVAAECCFKLVEFGWLVISPIAHWHWLARCNKSPMSFEYYRAWDLSLLQRCQGLVWLDMQGTLKSVGMQAELAEANKRNIPLIKWRLGNPAETAKDIDAKLRSKLSRTTYGRVANCRVQLCNAYASPDTTHGTERSEMERGGSGRRCR